MLKIFEGLEKFGLKNLDHEDIFAKKPAKKENSTTAKETAFNAKDYIFEKPFECPVCDKDFKNLVLKANKVRLITLEYDLRPIYEPIDPLYYDVIMCPHCGYAAITQKFSMITEFQSRLVHEFLAPRFKPSPPSEDIDLDTAIDRYKLALLCATKKKAKDGEKAFICMKLAWLYRAKGLKESEHTFMGLALNGFKTAYSSETPPICGLNDTTLNYLIGAFLKTLGQYDEATKVLSGLIISRTASSNLKERAKDLRDEIKTLQQAKK